MKKPNHMKSSQEPSGDHLTLGRYVKSMIVALLPIRYVTGTDPAVELHLLDVAKECASPIAKLQSSKTKNNIPKKFRTTVASLRNV